MTSPNITQLSVVAVLLLISMAFGACSQQEYQESHPTQEYVRQQAAKEHQQYVDITNKIAYIKDTRTNLCFAYMWNSITTVPCDAVSKYLK